MSAYFYVNTACPTGTCYAGSGGRKGRTRSKNNQNPLELGCEEGKNLPLAPPERPKYKLEGGQAPLVIGAH